MYLDENTLRTYIKCSELWHRQSKNKTLFNARTIIIKETLELIAAKQIKSTNQIQEINIQKYLLKSIHKHTKDWLDPAIQTITNELTLLIRELLKELKWDDLVIVHESFAYVFKELESHIELEFSFIAKANNIYHFVIWSPYSGVHSHKNDIINQLKLFAANEIAKKAKKKYVLHILHVTNNSNLEHSVMTSEEFSEASLLNAKTIIGNIRNEHHIPLTPCNYNCVFKNTCFPYRNRNE